MGQRDKRINNVKRLNLALCSMPYALDQINNKQQTTKNSLTYKPSK